jgi:DNA-binding NtrC family response regulator
MVAEGRFRADLYQRLNVFQIRVPPLRERPEDVEAQARHFLHAAQAGRDAPVTDFDPQVLEVLRQLPWEGNSRQLENFVLQTLAHKEGGTVVQMEDLPHWVHEALARNEGQPAEPGRADEPVPAAVPQGVSLDEAMDEFERRVLKAALEKNRGNRTKTAAELGLTPRSIFNKIKKYGLE